MTVPVGMVDPEKLRLLAVPEESLFRAIELVRPGALLADVCAAVEGCVRPRGYTCLLYTSPPSPLKWEKAS